MKNKLKLISCSFHRNGICGNPFFVAVFNDPENKDENSNGDMVGILFSEGECSCAVLDIDILSKRNVKFGENSWRGDRYYDQILKWKNKYLQEKNK